MCHKVRENERGEQNGKREGPETYSHQWRYEHPMPHLKRNNQKKKKIGEKEGERGKIKVEN